MSAPDVGRRRRRLAVACLAIALATAEVAPAAEVWRRTLWVDALVPEFGLLHRTPDGELLVGGWTMDVAGKARAHVWRLAPSGEVAQQLQVDLDGQPPARGAFAFAGRGGELTFLRHAPGKTLGFHRLAKSGELSRFGDEAPAGLEPLVWNVVDLDGGRHLAFGSWRDVGAAALAFDDAGAVSWFKTFPGRRSGALTAARRLADGRVLLAGVRSHAAAWFEGEREVFFAVVDGAGKELAQQSRAGRHVALFGPAESPAALVDGGTAGWKVLRLDAKLNVVGERPVAAGFAPLLFLRAAAVGTGHLAVLDGNGRQPRLSWLAVDGTIAASTTLYGAMSAPGARVIAGDGQSVYVVAPIPPHRGADGNVGSGVLVTQLAWGGS